MVKILLAAAVLLGSVTGCSVAGTTKGGTEHVGMAVTRSPVPLRATSSWIRAACGGFRDLRHFCPFAAATGGGSGITLSMAIGTRRFPLNLPKGRRAGDTAAKRPSGDPPPACPPTWADDLGWHTRPARAGAVDRSR